MYAVMCIHYVCTVRFYVFIHVSMRICMYLCTYFVVCLNSVPGIVCVSETCRSILKGNLFVFVLIMDKQV